MKDTWEIINIDGYYRFVSHVDQILTTGFKTELKLLEYKDDIRTDETATKSQHQAYLTHFKG